MKINRYLLLISITLFTLAFGYRLWGITSQFEAWDETAIVRVGEIYLDAWRNGDFSHNTWKLNKEHPPFSKYVYGATRVASLHTPYFSEVLDQDYPLGRRYTLQRVFSAFIGALSVLIVFYLVRKYYKRPYLGVFAGCVLAFTPYFIAHSRVATQENLVAFLTLFATAVFFKALNTNKLTSKLFLLTGVIWGLAMATKYNSIFFLVLFAVLVLIKYFREFIKAPKKLVINHIWLIPVIGVITFIAVWPWLWSNPWAQFFSSLSRINESRYEEYFLGQFPSPHPWYYFLTYLLATTPPIMLVGLLLFGVKFAVAREKYDLWFIAYFLTPLLATFSPLKMDGIRYIFTIYPAMAICVALGYGYLAKVIQKRFLVISAGIARTVIFLAVTGTIAITSISYHPYEWDYYNFIFGGPKGVYENRLFDFGYWGEGLRGAFRYIATNTTSEAPKRVLLKVVPMHVLPPWPAGAEYTDGVEVADYIITNPTGEWLSNDNYLTYDFPANFEIVYQQNVHGVPLVTVYRRLSAYAGPIPLNE